MPTKKTKEIKSGDLSGFWIDFLAVPGDKGGGRYRIYRIDYNNLTRSPPRRGAADQNSFQNLSNIEVAARMRFWSGPGRQKGARVNCDSPFWEPSSVKNRKNYNPKRHAKLDAEKVLKINGKRLPKIMQKWIPKSMKIQTFLKKAEMLETICFTIENVVLVT